MADFKVACDLANAYGFQINTNAPNQPRIGSAQSYDQWKHLHLNVYSPIRFHVRAFTPNFVTLTGLSGECLRYCYWPSSPKEFIASNSRFIPEDSFRERWEDSVYKALDEVSAHYEGYSSNPLFAHFREFRNRIHFATGPLQATIITPFCSAFMFDCVHAGNEEMLATGQITYDLMESLIPGLSKHSYEKAKKAPTTENHQLLTRVGCSAISPGRVYRGNVSLRTNREGASRAQNVLKQLAQDLEQSVDELPTEMFSSKQCLRAQLNMLKALNRGSLVAREGIPIFHAISAAQVYKHTA